MPPFLQTCRPRSSFLLCCYASLSRSHVASCFSVMVSKMPACVVPHASRIPIRASLATTLPSVAPHSPWPGESRALIPLAMAIPCSTLASSQVVLVIAFVVACSMAPQFVKFPMTPVGAATSLMALLQPPERLVETYQPTAPFACALPGLMRGVNEPHSKSRPQGNTNKPMVAFNI